MIMKTRLIIITSAILVVAFCFGSVGQAAPEQLGGGVHVVQWGENLASIALRYGTTVDAIVQANGISNQDYIYIGQQLTIPAFGNIGSPQMTPQMAIPAIASPGSVMDAGMGASPYTVQFGDTLTSISLRNGISVDALMQANGLGNSTIYIGQPLMIPGAGVMNAVMPNATQTGIGMGPSSYYSVRQGDTLSAIAFRHGTTVNDIMQVNNLYTASIFPGQQIIIPTGGPARGFEQPAATYHTVQNGDTLASLALRYGTTLPALLQANNLSQSQFIFPGQELVIPGSMNQTGLGPNMISGMPQAADMSNPFVMPGMASQMQTYPQQNQMVSGMSMPAVSQQQEITTGPAQMVPSVQSQMPLAGMQADTALSAPMVPPVVSSGGLMNMAGPIAPVLVPDNAPFISPEKKSAPDMTTKWDGRVVSQTQPEDWKYPSVLRVNVGGAKGMQVTVSKKGSNSWSTTGFTGTKPEYGDGAVEFAPLNPGKHVISLDGQGKGSEVTVDIKPNSLTYIEFVRVRADSGPTS